MPSDFLVDGQVSGLGTVHPLLTLSFISTWILPLHVVSSTLKRKSSSSVMDGLQRRRKEKRRRLSSSDETVLIVDLDGKAYDKSQRWMKFEQIIDYYEGFACFFRRR